MWFLHLCFVLQLSAWAVARNTTRPALAPRALEPFSVPLTRFWVETFGGEAFGLPVTLAGQTRLLHFDTGSHWIWVLSDLMVGDPYDNRKKFQVGDHETCPAPPLLYADKLQVDGVEIDSTVALHEDAELDETVFIAAVKITPDEVLSLHTPMAGTIGFSPVDDAWPLLALEDELITSTFTLDLQTTGASTLTFNQDKSQLSPSTVWYDVDTSQTQWQLKPPQDDPTTAATYLLDTGSTYVTAPPAAVEAYFANPVFQNKHKLQSGATSFWFTGCDQQMPDFDFHLGANAANAQRVRIHGPDLLGFPHPDSPGWCVALLRGNDVAPDPGQPGKETWYNLGLPFVKQVLLHMEIGEENKQVGVEIRS